EEEDQAASITKPTPTELLGIYDEDEEKDAVHDLPDFEANLAHLQETITHVEKFIPENRINDFIRSQEESEVVTEFRRANPDKEAELRPA
ncbi:hypothetical protein FOC1_g10002086, partial [Fusarium oxysporum f. sp. cubense race 1]